MKSFQTRSKRDDLSCLDDSSTMNINNTWILLPISHITLLSFCTKGLPGVAESTVSNSEGKPTPLGIGVRVRADEGWRKSALPQPTSTVCDGPPSGGWRQFFGMTNEKWNQEGVTPRSLSFLLLSNSMVKRRKIETTTSKVATARMVGLICSRIPENICQGMVR